MKKILKPAESEEAVYFSDFTGKPIGKEYGPQVTLEISTSYGSEYDGGGLSLHLSDDDLCALLDFLKTKLNKDTIEQLKKQNTLLEDEFDDAVQCRCWSTCDFINNQQNFNKKLL
jgi:hypothetical protein